MTEILIFTKGDKRKVGQFKNGANTMNDPNNPPIKTLYLRIFLFKTAPVKNNNMLSNKKFKNQIRSK